MINTSSFKTVAELDKAYSEHRDSLKAGGFLTPEGERNLMGAWVEAVRDLEDALSAPRDFSSL